MQIILASSSPRRIEIMNLFDLDFITKSSTIENSLILSSTVKINTMVSAFMKASDVYEKFLSDENTKSDMVVIGADTVVSIGEYQYGKPKNEQDSFKMLKSLSGKTHQVTTGYALISEKSKYVDCVSTSVTLKDLDEQMIKDYVNTMEGRGKAGSYAIQGKGSVLVREIKGDYANVVGLPISEIYEKLKNIFGIDLLKGE